MRALIIHVDIPDQIIRTDHAIQSGTVIEGDWEVIDKGVPDGNFWRHTIRYVGSIKAGTIIPRYF